MKEYIEIIKPKVMEGIELAKSLGASGAAISYSHSNSEGIGFESNRLKAGAAVESQSYAINVIINHRSGTASGNIPERLCDAVRSACELAKYGAASHFDEYPTPEKEFIPVKMYSESVKALNIDKQVADCQDLIDGLLKEDGELVAGADASIEESEGFIATSGGFSNSVKESNWTLSCGFQKTRGTDMLFAGSGRMWCELNSLYSKDDILGRCLFSLRHAENIVTTESGIVPLIIPPYVIRKFLSPLASAISGRSVAKGTSPLQDKLHTQCFARNLTILDNPHIDFAPSACAHDSVGIPTERRLLVENGILNYYLYDYDTACMTGNAPTGNDGCAPYTMLVSPGTESSESLIKSVKKGIFVEQLLGFGQTNMENGDFSANLALGYLVENGEIVGRVKNAMISGNIFELLKGDLQFSSDVHPYNQQPYTIMPGVSLKV